MLSSEGEDDAKKPALWMCYAGGSGFGGYAGYGGFNRRLRVFEVDANLSRITTWKRVEFGEPEELAKRVDEQVIVDGGRAVGPTMEEEAAEKDGPPL